VEVATDEKKRRRGASTAGRRAGGVWVWGVGMGMRAAGWAVCTRRSYPYMIRTNALLPRPCMRPNPGKHPGTPVALQLRGIGLLQMQPPAPPTSHKTARRESRFDMRRAVRPAITSRPCAFWACRARTFPEQVFGNRAMQHVLS
jgi:hypothetical protein